MASLYEGVILGMTLAIFFGFGPALFAEIQTSIHRGFWSGVQLAVGVFLSDVALVALSFFGAFKLLNKEENHLAFGIISGVILIIFGIVTYTRRVKITGNERVNDEDTPSVVTFILKGFFLNIANPFVWIFWMGVVVGFTAGSGKDEQNLLIFFSATLLTVLIMDVLKCFGAYKIKKYLTSNLIEWVNRIAGIGLTGFGIFLIIRSLYEFL
ncbi:MAG: LysE family translocator [Bacteroidales bacterium]|nr:LysE family translocator [Bacteroidales bacterium]MCF8387178.1 LysE family translocator [Bacteroidales bacterium]MCF8397670.1 LysE family translocator [Bacteroidales bacterium]